jgi:hypothetical protein
MKIFKKILLGFLAVLFVAVLGAYIYFKFYYFVPKPSQLTMTDAPIEIIFKWETALNANNEQENTAMLLPIQLKGCDRTFYMQFDLGAPTSMFYRNKLDDINRKFNVCKIDTTQSKPQLVDVNFTLDKTLINAKTMRVNQYSDDKINWNDTTQFEIIGTIGSDIIDNKMLLIDYPKAKLLIASQLADSSLFRAKFTKFSFKNRKIFIPTTIGTLQSDVLFDTGSSTFGLITNKENFDVMAKGGAKIIKNEGTSWGEKSYSYTTLSDAFFQFDDFQLPLKTVSYPEVEGDFKQKAMNFGMRKFKICGITGNKLFLDKQVIVDTKNLKFGIIQP